MLKTKPTPKANGHPKDVRVRDFFFGVVSCGQTDRHLCSPKSDIQFWSCTQILATIFWPCSAAQTCPLSVANRHDLHLEATDKCTNDDSALPIGKKCPYLCAFGYFFQASDATMTCQANNIDRTKQHGDWKPPGDGCQRA